MLTIVKHDTNMGQSPGKWPVTKAKVNEVWMAFVHSAIEINKASYPTIKHATSDTAWNSAYSFKTEKLQMPIFCSL